MEDGNSAQYTCPTDENLHFSTQNQKKKPGMILNLGTKNPIFGDQTPTPTRFIRNCEEVGLFQDLQNVNPFDETFRKAVEAGNTTSADFQAPSASGYSTGDDTLHTPHIFPHIIGVNERIGATEKLLLLPVANLSGAKEEEDKEEQDVKEEADPSELPITKCNLSVVVDSACNDMVEIGNMPTTPGAVQVFLQMLSDSQLEQLRQKKIETEQSLNTMLMEAVEKPGNNTVIIQKKPEDDGTTSKMSLAKQKLKSLLGNNMPSRPNKERLNEENQTNAKVTKTKSKYGPIKTQSPSGSVESEEDMKRKRFLERNRAAAMRCRERRKSWVADLEKRAERMQNANQELLLEVASLKAEVAQLKTLLLAHKDCPVTLAMSQGNIPTYVIDAVVPRLTTEPTVTKTASTSSTIFLTSPQLKKKQTSIEDINFRQNLKKRLCTSQSKSTESQAKRIRLVSEKSIIKPPDKNPSLGNCDEYLSSVLMTNPNTPFNDDDFDGFVPDKTENMEKPVATQVIQFNPNVLNRQNSLRLTSVENDEESIIEIESPSNDYS